MRKTNDVPENPTVDEGMKMAYDNLKLIANSIGAEILTLKIYEHDGKLEEAERTRKIIQRLENQLERMISLTRKTNDE